MPQYPGTLIERYHGLVCAAARYRIASHRYGEMLALFFAADVVRSYPEALAFLRELEPSLAAQFPTNLGDGVIGHG